MAYIVFARKYRPQKFEDITGQNHIVTILRHAVKNNRIPHAMLFSGPRGVGKTTTARILAKAINCENPENGEPCLKCKSCNDIRDGRDIDVIEIDGASNRGIDEIRDLREKAKYATFKGRYKIFIIDEVHMLTKEAFNALLKILEEPPEHVIFIFATTEPYNVIPTILSRTQRFDFKRISIFDIVGRLKFICENEKIEYDDKGLKLIARLADGSMRDASSILDQLASTDNRITYENVNTMFGRLDNDFFVKMIDYIINKDMKSLIDSLNEVLSKGYDIESFLGELSFYFHKLFLIKNEIKAEEIEIMDKELLRKAKFQADSFSNNSLIQITKELIETSSKLKFSSNKKMVVENQLSRIILMIDSKDIDEIITILKGFQGNSPSVIKEEKKNTGMIEEHIIKQTDFEKFKNIVEKKHFFLESALQHSHIEFISDNVYRIEVPFIYKNDFNQSTINKIIKENNLNLEIQIFYNNSDEYTKFKTSAIQSDERVKKIIDILDGEVI